MDSFSLIAHKLDEKVKALVKKVKTTKPVVPDTKDDAELEKSLDTERIVVEDSLKILLGHESGLNDVDYMLNLVDVNG